MTAPAPCPSCRRPARQHGHRSRHQRVCGPLSGTAAGPMSGDERERYTAAVASANSR
jgi:hypothetical protein